MNISQAFNKLAKLCQNDIPHAMNELSQVAMSYSSKDHQVIENPVILTIEDLVKNIQTADNDNQLNKIQEELNKLINQYKSMNKINAVVKHATKVCELLSEALKEYEPLLATVRENAAQELEKLKAYTEEASQTDERFLKNLINFINAVKDSHSSKEILTEYGDNLIKHHPNLANKFPTLNTYIDYKFNKPENLGITQENITAFVDLISPIDSSSNSALAKKPARQLVRLSHDLDELNNKLTDRKSILEKRTQAEDAKRQKALAAKSNRSVKFDETIVVIQLPGGQEKSALLDLIASTLPKHTSVPATPRHTSTSTISKFGLFHETKAPAFESEKKTDMPINKKG